jgi:hypothetical protein
MSKFGLMPSNGPMSEKFIKSSFSSSFAPRSLAILEIATGYEDEETMAETKMPSILRLTQYVYYGLILTLALNSQVALSGPVELGPLETWSFNGLQAKEVTLLNNKQMRIEQLYFTDEGPAVWFMVGKGSDYTEEFANLEGVIIRDEDNR